MKLLLIPIVLASLASTSFIYTGFVAGKIHQSKLDKSAQQIRLCVWYYDICHDSDKNPMHEAWTDHGKAQLTEWVRVKFPAELIDDLPGGVGEWVRRVKNG